MPNHDTRRSLRSSVHTSQPCTPDCSRYDRAGRLHCAGSDHTAPGSQGDRHSLHRLTARQSQQAHRSWTRNTRSSRTYVPTVWRESSVHGRTTVDMSLMDMPGEATVAMDLLTIDLSQYAVAHYHIHKKCVVHLLEHKNCRYLRGVRHRRDPRQCLCLEWRDGQWIKYVPRTFANP